MIGTPVVTLPSASAGGVLVVEHAGQTAIYRSSKLAGVARFGKRQSSTSPV
jgi:hypothetical protein